MMAATATHRSDASYPDGALPVLCLVSGALLFLMWATGALRPEGRAYLRMAIRRRARKRRAERVAPVPTEEGDSDEDEQLPHAEADTVMCYIAPGRHATRSDDKYD